MDFSIQKKGTLPFRIKVLKNRLAVEFSHIVTDGFGALTFLKALVAEYLASSGVKTDDWGDIFRKNGIPSNEEEDDSFLKHIPTDIPWPPVATEAFHLSGLKMPRHVYRIITGIISVSALNKKAAEYKVSSNDFLVSTALSACQDLEISRRINKQTRGTPPIRILIPVNLRGMFPSKSMKNFILYVMPEIIPALGYYSFEEIVHRTHHYLKMEIDRKTFNRHIFRNVISTNSFFFRILPLKVKNLTLSFFSWFFGERAYSTSLSNLGTVSLPEAFADKIERFDFYPPPNDRTGVNCSVIGFKDTLSISFGSSLYDHSIEQLFFRTLVQKGIKVKIETNIQGG